MGVKVAETAGFCMGVRRAVDIVLDIARHKGNEKVFTYGPLIHNPQTIELLEKRGVIPVKTLDDVDEGTIIIRAHGVSFLERQKIKEKGLKVIDATCPRVARVQSIIKKHSSMGYTVVIVGDKDHPEVTGLLGYCEGNGIVISSIDDIDVLPPMDKVCVVAQTTQNSDEYEELTGKIKEKFSDTHIFNTICDSTEKRQEEMRKLAAEMDAIIVVGGKISANTKRLAEISRESGTPTFHVETSDELEHLELNGYDDIGVSAGASTPNWITTGVIDYITQYREEKSHNKLRGLYNLWMFAVRTDIYSAIGAGCLSLVGSFVQGLKVSLVNILIASLYVFAMHTVNRLQDRTFSRLKGSFREDIYVRHKNIYGAAGFSSLVLALILSYMQGTASFTLLFLMSLFGLLYNIKVFPRSWTFRKMGDMPGSKTLFIAAAWALVTVVIPQIDISPVITPPMIVAFLFVFNVVFVKSALSDMIDIQSDRLVGRETIPVVIGEQRTKQLLQMISLFMGVLLVFAFFTGFASSLALVLLVSIFYVWICIKLCDMRTQFSSIVLEGLLETNFILAGICAYLWMVIVKYAA